MYISRQTAVPMSTTWPRLVADIGGTNARFGWLRGPQSALEQVRVLPCEAYQGLLEVVQAYLQQVGLPVPVCAAFGMANPVLGDSVQMTNLPWRFSVEDIREKLGLQTLLVLNDFTALMLAVPSIDSQHLETIGPHLPTRSGAMGLLGPGTGLGVSGWLPMQSSDQGTPIMGEGGHVTLAATNALEYAVIEQLRKRYDHVSAERVLSGTGIVDLYHTILAMHAECGTEVTTPAQVLALGMDGSSNPARQALDLFCGWLGSVAGDLALTLGAVGGIFIGGGIAPRLKSHLLQSDFRRRFEAKGRYQTYLQAIPTWLIDAPISPALDGAARALELNV